MCQVPTSNRFDFKDEEMTQNELRHSNREANVLASHCCDPSSTLGLGLMQESSLLSLPVPGFSPAVGSFLLPSVRFKVVSQTQLGELAFPSHKLRASLRELRCQLKSKSHDFS